MPVNKRNLTAGLVLAVILLGCAFAPTIQRALTPPRTEVITFNPGGIISDFYEHFTDLRRVGAKVQIDGLCISACTLVAGLLPPTQVCATSYAKLAFHSAFREMMGMRLHSAEGTHLLWEIYPEPLRALLRARGWDGGADEDKSEQKTLLYVSGDELFSVIPRCK